MDNETISSNGGVRPSSAAATDEAVEDEDNVWICPECSVAYVDGAADMVGCDGCDRWFHWLVLCVVFRRHSFRVVIVKYK